MVVHLEKMSVLNTVFLRVIISYPPPPTPGLAGSYQNMYHVRWNGVGRDRPWLSIWKDSLY